MRVKLQQILSTTGLSYNHKSMAQHGLLKLQLALVSGMDIFKIRDSFKEAGVSPFNLGKILSQCTTTLSAEDGLAIASALPKWAKIISEYGEIPDSVFNKCGIGALNTGSSKDHLILSRRRSVLVTNPAVIQREIKKREDAEAFKASEVSRKAAKKEQTAINKAKALERKEAKAAKSMQSSSSSSCV